MRAQPNSASLARLVAAARLQGRYNSLEDLEQKTQAEGIPPDDHTLYTELLEWRAINHELTDLLRIEALRASPSAPPFDRAQDKLRTGQYGQ